jgi:hydroxyacylglutathione hydrolase
MKRAVKISLVGLSITVFIILLIIVGLFVKFKSATKDMNPTPTKQIVENIFSIKDSNVNIFLIKDGDSFIAIDAGIDAENIKDEIRKLAIDPNKVIAILLTHTDRDHVAAIRIFKNARVYLAEQEQKMLNGEKLKFFSKNKIDAKDYNLLKDKQIFDINNIKVACILTPGHTSGSMCYLINDKYLFTGDILSLKAGKIDKSIDFFNIDSETANRSIELITHLPNVQYIFTAHFGYSSDYKKAVKDWK